MNELGQWLRETRESKGLSLAEAEAHTRIRQKFLAAMEAEEWNLLPGDITTRGFLRKYAAYLGLDPAVVVQRFQDRAKLGAAEVLAIPQVPADREVDYRPIEMDLSQEQGPQLPWRWIAIAGLLLVVGLAAWWVFAYRPAFLTNLSALLPNRLPNPGDLIAVEPSPTASPTTVVIRVTATPTATSEASPTPTPAPATPTPEAGATAESVVENTPTPAGSSTAESLRLQLQTQARSWVRVIADNRVVMEAVLEPGETRDWQAQQSISMRTGNAAGVQLTINDSAVGQLGGPGEVVEVTWTLEDGRLIQVRPTQAAAPTATAAPAEEPAAGEAEAQPTAAAPVDAQPVAGQVDGQTAVEQTDPEQTADQPGE